jgi:hypothetical protein
LIAGNLCLRQQFLVLERRTPRPRLRDRDRRSYLDSRLSMVASMARALLVVQPNDGRMELLRPTLYRQPLPLTLGDPPEAHGAGDGVERKLLGPQHLRQEARAFRRR